MLRIRPSREADLPAMLAIINDAAQAYRGVIPPDRWHEPYMPAQALESGIADGIVFWSSRHDVLLEFARPAIAAFRDA